MSAGVLRASLFPLYSLSRHLYMRYRSNNHTQNDMTKANSKGDASASELISRYIAELSDWRGKTLARIRKVFHEADPAIIEEWKWMGSPVWSYNGLVSVANAHRDKVKLTFSQGVSLPDPHNLFNASLGGNKWRAINFYKDDEINESALKELIRSAVSYNVSHLK